MINLISQNLLRNKTTQKRYSRQDLCILIYFSTLNRHQSDLTVYAEFGSKVNCKKLKYGRKNARELINFEKIPDLCTF